MTLRKQRVGSAISVVIPVYNHARYLGEAIASVLSQTLPPVEIIVVDDGSSEDIPQAVASFATHIRLFRQENRGPGAARNLGIRHSTGDILAFLDADDVWSNDKLELQMDALGREPVLALVFGKVRQFFSPDLDDAARRRLWCPGEATDARLSGTCLVRAEAFRSVGPFHEGVRVGEFIDWYARAKEAGLPESSVDPVILHRRIHAHNQGIRERTRTADYLHILKASIDRRRRAAASPGVAPQ